MNRNIGIGILIATLPCSPNGAFAGDQVASVNRLESLTLEELMDLSVEVVTNNKQPLRVAPGVVSVITREEIVGTGARDLIDVLSLVPGLHLGLDTWGVVSLGIRGVWAQEGKTLLLIDGQEFNEPLYSSLALGHHFPVDQIERIEIIRGPGSVIYGGFAELGVINIVTRGPDDFQGISLQSTAGQMASAYGRRSLGTQFAQTRLDGELKLSVSASYGAGHRSDRTYRDFRGGEFDMGDGARIDSRWLNAGLAYRGLDLRIIYDDYKLDARDGYEQVVPPVRTSFTTISAEARYTLPVGREWTLTPRVQFRRSVPWRVTDDTSPLFLDVTGDRSLVGLSAWFRPNGPVQFNGGVEETFERGKLNDTRQIGSQLPFKDGESSVHYNNHAGFAQILYEGRPANLTVGARYERHSAYGSSFVPRAAITRVFGPAHVKILYARAFRTPSFANISLGIDAKPERARVVEAEFGYQFDRRLYAGLNIFDQVVHRPIVYSYEASEEAYRNAGKTGSRGVEAEARIKFRGG